MSNGSTGNRESVPPPSPAAPPHVHPPYPAGPHPSAHPPYAPNYPPFYPPPGSLYPPPPYPIPVYTQPQRTSLAPLWIILAVAASLVLVACVGCAVLFSVSVANLPSTITGPSQVSSSTEDPVIAAETFCAYELDKDYSVAYSQLSSTLRSTLSEPQFQDDNQAREASAGALVGCSAALQSPATVSAGSREMLNVTIWLETPQAGDEAPTASSGGMTMVLEGTGWKVDAVESKLQLT